jgi:hypothetical protein
MPLALRRDVLAETLQALLTPAGGETVDAAILKRFQMRDATAVLPATILARIRTIQDIKSQRTTKLKAIALAMHNYHDVSNEFPVSGKANSNRTETFDENGHPKLSWRIHLLPFLQQQTLYDQFNLSEPWDSPHNRPLAAEMPDVFRDPVDDTNSVTTRFTRFRFADAKDSFPNGTAERSYRDGSGTLLVVIANAQNAMTWTQPDDLVIDPQSPLKQVERSENGAIFFVRTDAALRTVKSTIPAKWFHALVTPDGGERLPRGMSNYGEGRF